MNLLPRSHCSVQSHLMPPDFISLVATARGVLLAVQATLARLHYSIGLISTWDVDI